MNTDFAVEGSWAVRSVEAVAAAVVGGWAAETVLVEELTHLLGKVVEEGDEYMAKVGMGRRIVSGYSGVEEEELVAQEYEEFVAVAEVSLADFVVESSAEGLCGKNP